MNKEARLIFLCASIVFLVTLLHSASSESYAQTGSDLSSLRKWENKDPFVKFNGKMLFDTKKFQTVFKKTVGPKIYKTFMEAYKHDKYFQSGPIAKSSGILSINIQDLNVSFNTAIFIDTQNGHIDVCWQDDEDIDKNGNPLNLFLSHDGKTTKTRHPECRDLTYGQFLSTTNQSSLKEYKKQDVKQSGSLPPRTSRQKTLSTTIVGNWIGEFQMFNEQGVSIATKYFISIDEKIDKPGNYIFKEYVEKKASKPSVTFRCTGTNSYRAVTEGYIIVDQDDVKLVANSTSNPSCIQLGANTFELKNDTLSNSNMDGTNKLVVLHRAGR